MKRLKYIKPSILKETREEHRERIQYASTMRTRVLQNKRRKTRAQQKVSDIREVKYHE